MFSAFVINLDSSVDRLVRFMQRARETSLPVERVPAVDGRSVTRDQLATLTDRSAIYPLSRTEVGCFLSHREAWRRLLASPSPYAAVFEDDAILSADLVDILGDLAGLPQGPDLVQLESTPGRRLALRETGAVIRGRRLMRLRSVSIGSSGYMLSRKAASSLLQHSAILPCAVDLFLFDPLSPAWKGLTVAAVDPAPVIQEAHSAPPGGAHSTIEERGKELRPRLPLSAKWRKESRRVVRQVLGLGATRDSIPWA